MGTISRKLKQFRLAAGLTQEQLANELGVTRQALSNWEQGKTEPDLDMLKRICNVLQVDVKELIYGETEIKSEEAGVGKIEEQEIKSEVNLRDISTIKDISTISDIRGSGSTVTVEPWKKERDRKQGLGTKRIILIIIVVCCIFFVSIIVGFYLFFVPIKNSRQRIHSEQDSDVVSESACLLAIPEEKPRKSSNVKSVDSEMIQWFNTCMAIYSSWQKEDSKNMYGPGAARRICTDEEWENRSPHKGGNKGLCQYTI